MGLGGYLDTYEVYEVTDYYGTQYQKGTLAISVDIYGKLTWVLTMNNGNNGAPDGYGRAVGLYLNIGGNLLYNSYTDYSPNYSTSKWNTFPTGNDTSASGQFTVGSASFNVTLGISCMQGNVTTNGTTSNFTFDRNYWDNITNGNPPVIVDNGNNTFSITGYKGNSAHNNDLTKSQLEWTVQSFTNQNQYGWLNQNGVYFRSDFTVTETEKKLNLSFSDIDRDYGGSYPTDKATREVAATVINYDSYGQYTSNSYVYGKIKQYFPPSPPGKPELTPSSYKNGRLTIKNNWTFTWDAATKVNDSCPVKGYRIRLFRARTSSNGPTQHHTIPILDSHGSVISSGDTDIYYDTGSENTVFTIDPVAHDFVPGDLVRLEVQAYSFNGQGEQLLSAIVASPNYGVVNAGIVHIKVADEWKEGQVYVYEGTWKEASTVYVRDNNEWKEST